MKERLLIYGNGQSAKIVSDYVKSEFGSRFSVVGQYTDASDRKENLYSWSELTASQNDFYDAVMIPNQGKRMGDILHHHAELADKHVYYVPADSLRKPHPDTYYESLDVHKAWLNGFEFHVADHCNLNCKGCGHCANLFTEQNFPELRSYERDLKRLAELFDGIGMIRLLGGEPLLNPQLAEFILSTKAYFPRTELHIVTNGLLIEQMPINLIETIRDNTVILDISVYPPTSIRLSAIVEFVRNMGLECHLMHVDQFYKRFSIAPVFNSEQSFAVCETATCHALHQGKLAPCIVPFSTERLNLEYGLSVPITGWIDLFEEGLSGNIVNQRLRQPFELCCHCNPEKQFFEWKQKQYEDCTLQDWIYEGGETQ